MENIYRIPIRIRSIKTDRIAPQRKFVSLDDVGFALRYNDEEDIYDENGELDKDELRRYLVGVSMSYCLVMAEDLEGAVKKFRDEWAGWNTYPDHKEDDREARAYYIDTCEGRPICEFPKCWYLEKDGERFFCGEHSENGPFCTIEGYDPPMKSTGKVEDEICPFQVDDYWEERKDNVEKVEVSTHGFTNEFYFTSLVDVWDEKFIGDDSGEE